MFFTKDARGSLVNTISKTRKSVLRGNEAKVTIIFNDEGEVIGSIENLTSTRFRIFKLLKVIRDNQTKTFISFSHASNEDKKVKWLNKTI